LQIYTYGITTALKSKRFSFHNQYEVVVSTGMVVALGWWAVGPWYEYGGGPTATGMFT
jgi:hypothetical protein